MVRHLMEFVEELQAKGKLPNVLHAKIQNPKTAAGNDTNCQKSSLTVNKFGKLSENKIPKNCKETAKKWDRLSKRLFGLFQKNEDSERKVEVRIHYQVVQLPESQFGKFADLAVMTDLRFEKMRRKV